MITSSVRNKISLLIYFAYLGFFLPGCTENLSKERLNKDENTLRIAVPSDPRSLDPAIAYDVVTWPLVRTVFHGLIDYDDELNLFPWQAETWDISEDGKILTFTLRPDVRFSNGRTVVASDYVFTLERILNPKTKSPGQGFFRNIIGARDYQDGKIDHVSGLKAPDDRTFIIELLKPDLPFLYILAMPFAYVVPREEVEKAGVDFGVHPIGTGPYVLADWQRGLLLRFKRNPDFYDLADIKLKEIEIMVGGDETVHMMMFEQGELDIASVTSTGIPDPDFIRVMKNPELRRLVETQSLNAIFYLSMNTEMKPFDEVKVRKAVNHAIDRDRIIRLISDRGVPAKGVLPPGMPGYNPGLEGYAFDLDKSRQLLDEAGYKDGFSTELMIVAQNSTETKIGQAIQQDLEKVGIKIELKPVTGATRIEAMGHRNSVAFGTFGWYQDYPDPSNFLDVLLNGRRITNVNSNNVAFYNNEEVNKLLERAAFITDQPQRLELYQAAEKIIVDEAPWVFLYHPNMYILRQEWLKGLKLNPVWPLRYEKMWVE